VHLIASEENLGFGRAVNIVARQTTSDWIATANADIALRPGALDAMLEAGRRDARAGAIAPRLVLPTGETQHSVFAFPTILFSFYLAIAAFRFSRTIGDRRAFPGYWNSERARRVPWAIAAFLLFRRSAWDEVGGFDERQWMYAEDLDLGWRLQQAGWWTRYVPGAVFDHEGAAATSQAFGSDPAPNWQRSTYGFIARRWGVGHVWAIALINLAGALLRLAVTLARSARDPAAHAQRRRDLLRWARVQLGALRGRRALERIR
jgi:GT2 family glycosyltransferase